MKRLLSIITALLMAQVTQANVQLFLYPDISGDNVVFVHADALWIAPDTGGEARLLVSAEGNIRYPRFSPDGQQVAFSANIGGNTDLYVVDIRDPVPRRITHHPAVDRLIDWHPLQDRLVYATPMTSESRRFNQLYSVPAAGGLPARIPLPYGETAAFSADGNRLAYTAIRDTFDFGGRRDWKRYRGGQAPDILLYDLLSNSVRNIAPHPAVDSVPMWRGDVIYFLSERGRNRRANIWAFDTADERLRQLTCFTRYDVRHPSAGAGRIIFQAGGRLHLLDLIDESYQELDISIPGQGKAAANISVPVGHMITHTDLSADGKQALFEARGEIFLAPVRPGRKFINLTQTSGIAERYPAWMPDGTSLVYTSDESGEYELYHKRAGIDAVATRLTDRGGGYIYKPQVSPDGSKLAFIDHSMSINLLDISNKELTQLDKLRWLRDGTAHRMLEEYRVSWSPDSRRLAYSRGLDNRNHAVFIFDADRQQTHQITSGFYNDYNPLFSPDGNYLYLLTSRNFEPVFSDLDPVWAYINATRIAALPLRKDVPGPGDYYRKRGLEDSDRNDGLVMEFDEIERRMVLLPPEAGLYGDMKMSGNRLFYERRSAPDHGSTASLFYFDVNKYREYRIAPEIANYAVSAAATRLVVQRGTEFYVAPVRKNSRLKDKIAVDNMKASIDKRQEWQQLLRDSWRFERDYFYDENLHGIDWSALFSRYRDLMEGAASRHQAYFVIRELVTELGAGHMYVRPGNDPDKPVTKTGGTGMLGINFVPDSGYYRIGEIIDTGMHSSRLRSPLGAPGIRATAGDYILEVNGKSLPTDSDPWPVFAGLAGERVELTLNDRPQLQGAWTVEIEAMSAQQDYLLRELAWMERNRKRVLGMSGGRIGYIYVPDTLVHGQNELMRQFRAQFSLPGLIIDERFNSGGALGDRLVELLNRPIYNYLSVRHGDTFHIPEITHTGPKAMLINGWSGSGGDGFPYYFRKAGLGPLVGMPTWGGLVGPSDYLPLIDGGGISAPPSRVFSTAGEWVVEGEGVLPDIRVENDPVMLMQGRDAQIETAVDILSGELDKQGAQPADPVPPVISVH